MCRFKVYPPGNMTSRNLEFTLQRELLSIDDAMTHMMVLHPSLDMFAFCETHV